MELMTDEQFEAAMIGQEIKKSIDLDVASVLLTKADDDRYNLFINTPVGRHLMIEGVTIPSIAPSIAPVTV